MFVVGTCSDAAWLYVNLVVDNLQESHLWRNFLPK